MSALDTHIDTRYQLFKAVESILERHGVYARGAEGPSIGGYLGQVEITVPGLVLCTNERNKVTFTRTFCRIRPTDRHEFTPVTWVDVPEWLARCALEIGEQIDAALAGPRDDATRGMDADTAQGRGVGRAP